MSVRSTSVASSTRSSDALAAGKTANYTIQLIDRTVGNDENTTSDREPPSPISPTRSADLSIRLARSSLREQVVRRKYAKWQQTQGPDDQSTASQEAGTGERESTPRPEESRIQRSRAKIKNILNPRMATASTRSTSHVDILYENQRGTFFFGIPFFSSNSLLNFDPPAWQNAQFHPSPVDITNAQVPDPSWEWEWPKWYVDMSRDVDEEGWEYSFKFGPRFSWHGTNPWWCSFVRRRRWLRRRMRTKLPTKREVDKDPMRAAHHFNAEYFTIHTGRDRSKSPIGTAAESRMAPAGWKGKEDVEEDEDIKDIATLMTILRQANVDREKIVAVQKFVNQGGEELFYLADEMPHILALLLYQSSRKQLLTILLEKIDKLHEKAHHQQHNGSPEQTPAEKPDDEMQQKELDYLHRALTTAGQQVKRLEFWSDIRQVAQQKETTTAWDDTWHRAHRSGSESGSASTGHEGSESPRDKSGVNNLNGSRNGKVDKGKGKETMGVAGE